MRLSKICVKIVNSLEEARHMKILHLPLRFLGTYIVAFAIFLTFALLFQQSISADGPMGATVPYLSKIRASLGASVYFLIVSGYLAGYVVCCFLVKRMTERRTRILVGVGLFVITYFIFFVFMANTFHADEVVMFFLGCIGVIASDFLASIMLPASKTH